MPLGKLIFRRVYFYPLLIVMSSAYQDTGDYCFARVIVLGKPKENRYRSGLKNGGLAGTRTQDQRLKRPLLYRLSYQPIKPGRSEDSLWTRGIQQRPRR